MNTEKVKVILAGTLQKDGSLFNPKKHLFWKPGYSKTVIHEEYFSPSEIEAIRWWINYRKKYG